MKYVCTILQLYHEPFSDLKDFLFRYPGICTSETRKRLGKRKNNDNDLYLLSNYSWIHPAECANTNEHYNQRIIRVKHFTDSFLYKTHVHTFIQADYQWKRFSIGVSYTRDLQPYVRYAKPG